MAYTPDFWRNARFLFCPSEVEAPSFLLHQQQWFEAELKGFPPVQSASQSDAAFIEGWRCRLGVGNKNPSPAPVPRWICCFRQLFPTSNLRQIPSPKMISDQFSQNIIGFLGIRMPQEFRGIWKNYEEF